MKFSKIIENQKNLLNIIKNVKFKEFSNKNKEIKVYNKNDEKKQKPKYTIKKNEEKEINKKTPKASIFIPLYLKNEKLFTLFIQRANKGKYPNQYAFPGGHIDENENYMDASIRETHEEIGITQKENQLQVLNELPIFQSRKDMFVKVKLFS
jgi:hypothetical protein